MAYIGHSLEPTIIVPTGKKEIAVISSKLFRKVLAARQNIELLQNDMLAERR